MSTTDNKNTNDHEAQHSEHVAPPSTSTKMTWSELWEHKRVLAWCFFIFLLPINFGYEASTVGNLLAVDPFLEQFGVEVNGVREVRATDQQILNAATTVGLFCSAFATGIISDFLGRKKTIILGCVLCVAGIVTQYFVSTIIQLFGGKLLATFGFGLGHSLGPVFVAELAPVRVRGLCLSLVNTMIVVGQWLNSAAVLGSQHHKDSLGWRIPIITQMIPPGLLLLGLPFLPESPSWLIMHGRPEEAAKSFRKFNGPKFDVDEAMAITTAAVEQEQELARTGSAWIDCFKGSDGRRTLIICMVYIAQQFVGVNFVSGYLTYYFKLAGVDNALGVAQAAFAIQLVGNICSWPLVDRLGRRPLIVGGMLVMTCGLLLIGLISISTSNAALKATVAFMTLWGFLYQATLGAVSYAVGGETPSPLLRQKTYSINIMSATAVSCAVLQIMPYLLNTDEANLGGKICFIFFGLSVPMCVYLYFCLPELKGRTVAEIQEMFQAGLPARKFGSYVCQNTVEIEMNKAKGDRA
ncbi:general substrate transporter [Aspergillus karnatakaensis]|uniref:general substrate transporter n=1 Tax=Aspergillus karnatakaensis TaxID=1810916 RepID=UPI003CCD62DD